MQESLILPSKKRKLPSMANNPQLQNHPLGFSQLFHDFLVDLVPHVALHLHYHLEFVFLLALLQEWCQ